MNGPAPLALERAEALLDELAPRGSVPAAELAERARLVGISPRTLERARRRRGCRAVKVGRGWYVTIPAKKEAAS